MSQPEGSGKPGLTSRPPTSEALAGGWGPTWALPSLTCPSVLCSNFYAVPSLEPSVLLPPQSLPGGNAPHWGPELSNITPKALARPHPLPPHRRMPPARPIPRIAWATICRYLCLLGRQHSEGPILYLFWVLFCTEREHRSDFLGQRQKTQKTQEEAAATGLDGSGSTCPPILGDLPHQLGGSSKAYSLQGSHGGLQRGQALEPLLAPELDEATVGSLSRAPPSPQVWDPSRPGLAMPCVLSATSYRHRKYVLKHVCLAVTITPGDDWEQPPCLPPIPGKP